MKTADAIWMCLPEGLNELFEMVRFEILVSAKTFKPYLAFYFPRTADILNV